MKSGVLYIVLCVAEFFLGCIAAASIILSALKLAGMDSPRMFDVHTFAAVCYVLSLLMIARVQRGILSKQFDDVKGHFDRLGDMINGISLRVNDQQEEIDEFEAMNEDVTWCKDEIQNVKRMFTRDNERWSKSIGKMEKGLRAFTIKKVHRLGDVIDGVALRLSRLETEDSSVSESLNHLNEEQDALELRINSVQATAKYEAEAAKMAIAVNQQAVEKLLKEEVDRAKADLEGLARYNVEGFTSQMDAMLELLNQATGEAQEALKRGTENRHSIESLTTRLVDTTDRLKQEIDDNRANMDAVMSARELGIKGTVEANARNTWDRINTANSRISAVQSQFDNTLVGIKARIESLEHEAREDRATSNDNSVATAENIRKLKVMVEATALKSDEYQEKMRAEVESIYETIKQGTDDLNDKIAAVSYRTGDRPVNVQLSRILEAVSAKFSTLADDLKYGDDTEDDDDDLADPAVIPEDNG
jgi:predicted  nucleic acid-binding Zn-ribbon protein